MQVVGEFIGILTEKDYVLFPSFGSLLTWHLVVSGKPVFREESFRS